MHAGFPCREPVFQAGHTGGSFRLAQEFAKLRLVRLLGIDHAPDRSDKVLGDSAIGHLPVRLFQQSSIRGIGFNIGRAVRQSGLMPRL